MSAKHAAETAKIHARLNHPVIDSDGHWIEFEPAAVDYLRQVGGEKIVERYSKVANQFGNKNGRRPRLKSDVNVVCSSLAVGVLSKNTRDRATAMLPKLLYERMGELGLDFCVIHRLQDPFLPHFCGTKK